MLKLSHTELVTYCGTHVCDVDAQNIVSQFVLAEIDVHGRYGDEEWLEYGSSACVVDSQKAPEGIPSSRLRARIVLNVCNRVLQRHAVLLEQRVP